MENKRDVLYLVKLDKNEMDKSELGYMFKNTYIGYLFCGYLVNHANTKMWFEVNNTDRALVCIPTRWIEWMAQSKNQPSSDIDESEENLNEY